MNWISCNVSETEVSSGNETEVTGATPDITESMFLYTGDIFSTMCSKCIITVCAITVVQLSNTCGSMYCLGCSVNQDWPCDFKVSDNCEAMELGSMENFDIFIL